MSKTSLNTLTKINIISAFSSRSWSSRRRDADLRESPGGILPDQQHLISVGKEVEAATKKIPGAATKTQPSQIKK